MALEPSLSELTNISPDPGAAPPIIDGTHIVNTLNQNARFHAENVANKYNTFLQNKKDLYKDIGNIQDLDTLAQDSPVLKQQAADIFKQLQDNPSIVYGGKGFDELQGKISQFKQNAMASKQANFDYKTNKMFLDRNPELYTDENKAAIEGELKKPLNSRTPVLLNMPTILDTKTAFEGLVKDSMHDYSVPVVKDGVPYIESGKELNPNAVENAWGLISKGGQTDKFGHDLLGAVKYNYSKLPERDKQNYDALSKQAKEGGDLSATPEHMYWKDYGSKYLNAYFPDGSYTKTPEGNLRFAENLTKDPYYIGQQTLAETKAWHNAQTQLDWYKAKHPAGKEDKPPEVLDAPSLLFGSHIDRLKKIFAKDDTPISVDYKGTDDKTRTAANLKEGDSITYYPDGNFTVSNKKGAVTSKGTIDNLVQGFIDAVKTINIAGGKDRDGTMAEGFQKASENSFKKHFGTTSGKEIWDNWGKGVNDNKTPQTENKPPVKQVAPKAQVISGYEVPQGATVVYSKKTGKALGYTLNGKNYQF